MTQTTELTETHRARIRELRKMMVHIKTDPLLDEHGHPIHFAMPAYRERNSCGTACCAVGHMPYWPPFKADGWTYPIDSYVPQIEEEGRNGGADGYFGTADISDDVFHGDYFDEARADVSNPLGYKYWADVTVDDVIARIDEIMERHGIEP